MRRHIGWSATGFLWCGRGAARPAGTGEVLPLLSGTGTGAALALGLLAWMGEGGVWVFTDLTRITKVA